jgi:chromosomal replication initiation ATPase DnaA
VTATQTPTGRLQKLYSLRRQIDDEIAREERFQQRIRHITRQARTAAMTTRGDWPTRVMHACADYFGTSPEEMRSETRTQDVIDARHVAAWLLRATDRTYHEIAEVLAQHHTTCMYGVKRVERTERIKAAAMELQRDLTGEQVAS